MTQTAAVGTPSCACELECLIVQVHGIIQSRQHWRYALLCLFQQVLKIKQHGFRLISIDECRGNPCFAATTGTTYAMHVILYLVRHVVVDDVLDVWEVQTLGGHICGNKHILFLALEHVNGVLAFLLVHTAVNCNRLHALKQQVLVDVVHVSFVLAKHQHRRAGLLKALQQVHNLRLLLDVLHLLDDVQVGGARASHVHNHRVHQR
mmetsp:Transcript_35459/g.66841  ORF Transcript_35459/g.66841 Transcript_35459/m.66841 type:complete len:206 (-) Transcript_35459:1348-1965(-)